MPEPEKEKKLWKVDSTIYSQGKSKITDRVKELLRSLGKALLYLGFFLYPLALVITGVVFGGLVFWTIFSGSVIVISVILARLGYARTFAQRDFPFFRSLIGLCGGFLAALGFYLGLFTIQWWIFPIIGTIAVLAIAVKLKRGR